MRIYLNATQKGYVVGVEDKGKKLDMYFFNHSAYPSTAEVNEVYRKASLKASVLETTLKKRPDIIRRRMRAMSIYNLFMEEFIATPEATKNS